MEPFSIRIPVRDYEIDAQGHVSAVVYQQWAHYSSMECIRNAGARVDELVEKGFGPIDLEVTTRFHRELRVGEEVDVTCEFEWNSGRTYRIKQEVRKVDGSLAAEVVTLGAVLDLARRRMVPHPAEQIVAVTEHPERLGISPTVSVGSEQS